MANKRETMGAFCERIQYGTSLRNIMRLRQYPETELRRSIKSLSRILSNTRLPMISDEIILMRELNYCVVTFAVQTGTSLTTPIRPRAADTFVDILKAYGVEFDTTNKPTKTGLEQLKEFKALKPRILALLNRSDATYHVYSLMAASLGFDYYMALVPADGETWRVILQTMQGAHMKGKVTEAQLSELIASGARLDRNLEDTRKVSDETSVMKTSAEVVQDFNRVAFAYKTSGGELQDERIANILDTMFPKNPNSFMSLSLTAIETIFQLTGKKMKIHIWMNENIGRSQRIQAGDVTPRDIETHEVRDAYTPCGVYSSFGVVMKEIAQLTYGSDWIDKLAVRYKNTVVGNNQLRLAGFQAFLTDFDSKVMIEL